MTSQGYLYFDLHRGCTSPMLVSAMASLGVLAQDFAEGFKKAGLSDIKVIIKPVVREGLKCQAVYFYFNEQLITLKEKSRSFIKHNAPFKPKWDAPLVNAMTVMSPDILDKTSRCSFINRCLGPDAVSLQEIEEFIRKTNSAPDVVGLTLQIITHLKSELLTEQTMNGDEALWFTVHLLAICIGLRTLDPSFVHATKIVTSNAFRKDNLKDSTWLYETISGLPVIDTGHAVSIDVLAVAFLKTVVAHYGERGESTIVKVGIGSETSMDNCAHGMTALLCEAMLPSTIVEASLGDGLRPALMYEASALIPVRSPLILLAEELERLQAKELHQLLVHRDNESLFSVRFIIGEENKDAALKALFTTGQADHVTMKQASMYALKERLVAVPVGYGNKQISVRFMEFVLGEEIVKVDPVEEDLLSYMHQTDFSMDVARRDLLEAWKKWHRPA